MNVITRSPDHKKILRARGRVLLELHLNLKRRRIPLHERFLKAANDLAKIEMWMESVEYELRRLVN